MRIDWGGSLSYAKEIGFYPIEEPLEVPEQGKRHDGICGWKALPGIWVEDAHTQRCLGTSVLWSLGTSAVPGAYLPVHRHESQQVGAWEEQNWQGLAKGIRFLCPSQGKSHLLHAGLSQATQQVAFPPALQAQVVNIQLKGYKVQNVKELRKSKAPALASAQQMP